MLSGCSILGISDDKNNLTLKELHGGSVSLENLKGKHTLLHFWSTWCKMCKHELITLQNLERATNKKDFQIISVAIDSSMQDILELTENYHLTLKILLDSNDKAKEFYKVTDVPMSMLLNKEGKPVRFKEPDSNKLVKKTKGPQSWDRPEVINYFKNSLPD